MERRWEWFGDALESGDAERINEALDELEALDVDERTQLFAELFNGLTALYARSDDGYVRQATVRVAERLTPGLAVAVDSSADEQAMSAVETLREQTDALCGFLLEALTDDDGRVRRSAIRGLQDVFRTYDAFGDEQTLAALVAELDDMADEHSGKQREYLLEVKDDAEFNLQSGYAQILTDFQQER